MILKFLRYVISQKATHLKEGDRAPDFEALDGHGKLVRSADFRGKRHLVLFFYPKDDTPG